jgi:hypothetical protein
VIPFLTAYDPLGGTSGSIDPLGAMQTYGAASAASSEAPGPAGGADPGRAVRGGRRTP